MTQAVSYFVIQIAANIVIELLLIRAYCKLLDLKHPVAFAALTYLFMVASALLKGTAPVGLVVILSISIVTSFVLPLLLSQKPLGSSILRIGLIMAAVAIGESASMIVYSTLTGAGVFPQSIEEAHLTEMALSYIACITGIAATLEIILLFFSRVDHQTSSPLQAPVIALTIWSYLFMMLLAQRLGVTRISKPMMSAASLLLSALTIIVIIAALEVAQQDLRTSQRNADQAARVRQARHIRAEVTDITRSSMSVRHLRHDMANQIGVIEELFQEGMGDKADWYLAQLQERADALTSSGQDHPEDVAS